MLSEDIYSQFLRFQVQESAPSTFTGGSPILTGASVNRVGDKNIALEIHAINAQLSFPVDSPGAGVVEQVLFCLSTRSDLAAMPTMDAEHVIYMTNVAVKAGVAVYLPLTLDRGGYMPSYVEFKYALLISHAKLYPYLISTNAGASASMYGFILFTYVLLDADLAIEALESFR